MSTTIKTYIYRPSMIALVFIMLIVLEYTTRCGDAYR
jgi:hypothetical protein